jgi:hypothetical protein
MLPMEEGREPVMQLVYKRREIRFVRLPIDEGREPVMELECR